MSSTRIVNEVTPWSDTAPIVRCADRRNMFRCTGCGSSTNLVFACSKQGDGVEKCDECFSRTPCGLGEHGRYCARSRCGNERSLKSRLHLRVVLEAVDGGLRREAGLLLPEYLL